MFHICTCLTIFTYIRIRYDIFKYMENENLKPLCFSQHNQCSVTNLTFVTSRKESTGLEVSKEVELNFT